MTNWYSRLALGVILTTALVVAGVFVYDRGYLDATPFQISEVEVQSTTRTCVIGQFVAPYVTQDLIYGTTAFLCGNDLKYHSQPDGPILNLPPEQFN